MFLAGSWGADFHPELQPREDGSLGLVEHHHVHAASARRATEVLLAHQPL